MNTPGAARLETLTQWLNAPPDGRVRAVQDCVDRIRDQDPALRAWVQVRTGEPGGSGPLSGIPYGAKDVIETHGFATEYGSPLYAGRLGSTDAAIISDLRRRGAILLGKTQCASFAYRTPSPTRNPRDPEHTPGGSSSGSAAAVAAGMVPFTIGTQTLGSVLRPASYCGVTGFKPTWGLLPVDGILPLSHSLDTLGFFTHTPADMLALWTAMEQPTDAGVDLALGAPDPMTEIEPDMAAAFEQALTRLRRAGVAIQPLDLAGTLAGLAAASHTVMFYEGARAHEARYREHGERIADLADLVREGLQIPPAHYDEAMQYIGACRARVGEMFAATPVILVPAATGAAPAGLGWTGDARMNAPWTALGTPAISIPMPVASGLPLGLQLTANRGDDARVLRTAVRIDGILH